MCGYIDCTQVITQQYQVDIVMVSTEKPTIPNQTFHMSLYIGI